MAGIYDRLRDQLDDDDDRPSGMTALDIADLPASQRRVMFALLRDTQAGAEGVTASDVAARLDDASGLADALDALTRLGWLIRRGEPPRERYKVNLRRRSRGGGLDMNVWALLVDRLAPEADDDAPGQKPGHDFPKMTDW
jgi:hypothetical protein